MSNSRTAGLCLFFTVTLAFGLGCTDPSENSGYCVDDRECTQGTICDIATQRCTRPSALNTRTDAALDRVLDMEIDAMSIDAMVVDALIQDASPVDAVVTDLSLVDEGIEGDATPAVDDVSVLDAITVDVAVVDAQTVLDSAVEPDAEATDVDMSGPDAEVSE